MKRIYLLMILFIAMAGNAMAQRAINLETKMMKPTANQSIAAGTNFNIEIVWTNKGPDPINIGDTLAYVYTNGPANTIFIIEIKKAKIMGDTIQMKTSLGVPTTFPSGNLNFCYVATILKGKSNTTITDSDTSNNRSCNIIKITGGSSGGGTGIFTVANVIEQNAALAIVPNPATAEVKFNFVSKSDAEVNARVTDITGRVVYSHNYGKAYTGQTDYSLNISNLNAGIYFVELNQDGHRAVGKMIKQ